MCIADAINQTFTASVNVQVVVLLNACIAKQHVLPVSALLRFIDINVFPTSETVEKARIFRRVKLALQIYIFIRRQHFRFIIEAIESDRCIK